MAHFNLSSVLQRTVSLRRKMRGKTRDEGLKTGWLYRGQRGALYDTWDNHATVLPPDSGGGRYAAVKVAVGDVQRSGPVSVNGTVHCAPDAVWIGPPQDAWHGGDSYDRRPSATYTNDGKDIYNHNGGAIYSDSGATTQVYVNGVHVLCMNDGPYNERNIDEEIAARARREGEPPYAQPRKLAERDACNNWIPAADPELRAETGYCVMVRSPCPAYRPPPEVTPHPVEVTSRKIESTSRFSEVTPHISVTSHRAEVTSSSADASPRSAAAEPGRPESYACLRRSYTNFYTEEELRGLDSSDRDTMPRRSAADGAPPRRRAAATSGRWKTRVKDESYVRRKARSRSAEPCDAGSPARSRVEEHGPLRRTRRRSGSLEPCECSACSDESFDSELADCGDRKVARSLSRAPRRL
ncbi:uncharacterized protein LOC119091047 [Pollicipes pollicipes]|uniref:uncharacterized protein LOC119091047 n=1 Tax=Pollicipes pollicipes TaxID=41117 RepID=UPI001885940E|nr:uncharacterized protein LOC119091047 [Pollicipes pollicipes]